MAGSADTDGDTVNVAGVLARGNISKGQVLSVADGFFWHAAIPLPQWKVRGMLAGSVSPRLPPVPLPGDGWGDLVFVVNATCTMSLLNDYRHSGGTQNASVAASWSEEKEGSKTLHIAAVASRAIKADEPLLMDYGAKFAGWGIDPYACLEDDGVFIEVERKILQTETTKTYIPTNECLEEPADEDIDENLGKDDEGDGEGEGDEGEESEGDEDEAVDEEAEDADEEAVEENDSEETSSDTSNEEGQDSDEYVPPSGKRKSKKKEREKQEKEKKSKKEEKENKKKKRAKENKRDTPESEKKKKKRRKREQKREKKKASNKSKRGGNKDSEPGFTTPPKKKLKAKHQVNKEADSGEAITVSPATTRPRIPKLPAPQNPKAYCASCGAKEALHIFTCSKGDCDKKAVWCNPCKDKRTQVCHTCAGPDPCKKCSNWKPVKLCSNCKAPFCSECASQRGGARFLCKACFKIADHCTPGTSEEVPASRRRNRDTGKSSMHTNTRTESHVHIIQINNVRNMLCIVVVVNCSTVPHEFDGLQLTASVDS